MIISPEDFKNCLSHFAKGVTIVTSHNPYGENIGVTVDSFNSVSLEPPLILFSIGKTSLSHDVLLNANDFVINILSAEQSNLSNIFASRSKEKWLNVSYFLSSLTKNRVIEDCLYYIECEKYASYPGGDHSIILGQVINIVRVKEEKPLIYYKGKYYTII